MEGTPRHSSRQCDNLAASSLTPLTHHTTPHTTTHGICDDSIGIAVSSSNSSQDTLDVSLPAPIPPPPPDDETTNHSSSLEGCVTVLTCHTSHRVPRLSAITPPPPICVQLDDGELRQEFSLPISEVVLSVNQDQLVGYNTENDTRENLDNSNDFSYQNKCSIVSSDSSSDSPVVKCDKTDKTSDVPPVAIVSDKSNTISSPAPSLNKFEEAIVADKSNSISSPALSLNKFEAAKSNNINSTSGPILSEFAEHLEASRCESPEAMADHNQTIVTSAPSDERTAPVDTSTSAQLVLHSSVKHQNQDNKTCGAANDYLVRPLERLQSTTTLSTGTDNTCDSFLRSSSDLSTHGEAYQRIAATIVGDRSTTPLLVTEALGFDSNSPPLVSVIPPHRRSALLDPSMQDNYLGSTLKTTDCFKDLLHTPYCKENLSLEIINTDGKFPLTSFNKLVNSFDDKSRSSVDRLENRQCLTEVSPKVTKFASLLAKELVEEAVLLSSTQAWNIRCSGQCHREQCRQEYYQSLVSTRAFDCYAKKSGYTSSSSGGRSSSASSSAWHQRRDSAGPRLLAGASPGLCWTPELPIDDIISSSPCKELYPDNNSCHQTHKDVGTDASINVCAEPDETSVQCKENVEMNAPIDSSCNLQVMASPSRTTQPSSMGFVCSLSQNFIGDESNTQETHLLKCELSQEEGLIGESSHPSKSSQLAERKKYFTDSSVNTTSGSRGVSTRNSSKEVNISHRRKRRSKTRKRSSSSRTRSSKSSSHGIVSSGKVSSRRQRTDATDVYSVPIDSLADPTIVHPKAIIGNRRYNTRKHRVTSSTITAGLPYLNASSIATNITPNIAFAERDNSDAIFTKTNDFQFICKKMAEKDYNKKINGTRNGRSLISSIDLSSPSSRQSVVSTIGPNINSTSVVPSSNFKSHPDGKQSVTSDPSFLASSADVQNTFIESDNTVQSDKVKPNYSNARVSRKDRHEHHRICRILPFTALKSCKRKDHSSESREEVYMASSQGVTKSAHSTERKRGHSLFSSIRSSLLSLFNLSSTDKVSSKEQSRLQQTSSGVCSSASVDRESQTPSTSPTSDEDNLSPKEIAGPSQPSMIGIDKQSSSDLLNHSNYSAFTSVINDSTNSNGNNGLLRNLITEPISAVDASNNEPLDKEVLEEVADASVEVGEQREASIPCFIVPRSPVVNAGCRALPPLPGREVPPVPPARPAQSMLTAVTHPLPLVEELLPLQNNNNANKKEEGCHFASMIEKVKDYGWYWGPISSKAAEKIVSNEPDGSFIVRDSSDDHYIFSLTFRLNGFTRHVRIEHDQGNFSFGGFTKFKSQTIVEFIESAVEHSRSGRYLFFLHRRPVLGPMRVQLLHPVSRHKHIQSLQHLCRFVIVKNVRRDLLQQLPLPPRLRDYLTSPHYYSEQVDLCMAEEEQEEEHNVTSRNDNNINLNDRNTASVATNTGAVTGSNNNNDDGDEGSSRNCASAATNTAANNNRNTTTANRNATDANQVNDTANSNVINRNTNTVNRDTFASNKDTNLLITDNRLSNDVSNAASSQDELPFQLEEGTSNKQSSLKQSLRKKEKFLKGAWKTKSAVDDESCALIDFELLQSRGSEVELESVCKDGSQLLHTAQERGNDTSLTGATLNVLAVGESAFKSDRSLGKLNSNKHCSDLPLNETKSRTPLSLSSYLNAAHSKTTTENRPCKIVSYEVDFDPDHPTVTKLTKLIETDPANKLNDKLIGQISETSLTNSVDNRKTVLDIEETFSICVKDELQSLSSSFDAHLKESLLSSSKRLELLAACGDDPVAVAGDSSEGRADDCSAAPEPRPSSLASVILNASLEELGTF